jgi:TRAP-type uncharacterized transport system substrate-binding protein
MWQKMKRGNFLLLSQRELRILGLIALGLIACVLWILFRYIEPPPPKTVRIATGSQSGAYFKYSQQYAGLFAQHGIKLEIVQTAGSVENLALLKDPKRKIDIAFVQGGIAKSEDHPHLESLASVAYEPIWLFYNKKSFPQAAPAPQRLTEFVGKSIAIGVEGGGGRPVALELLRMNKVTDTGGKFLPLGGTAAVEAVVKGSIDAAFIIAAVDAPAVQQALDQGLGLLSFERADAYARMLPWIAKISLPKGAINLASNYPAQDVTLIAATANLVARADLHRAIMFLVLDVANTVHRKPSVLNAMTDFPSDRNLDFLQSDESKRYFKTGRPFLQQYLPFWLANLIERLLVTIVPILAIGLPLIKIIPAIFEWRERAIIAQFYDETLVIEHTRFTSAEQRAAAVKRLYDIDNALPHLKLGAAQHVNLYNLKAHLDMVISRITAQPHQA